MQEVTAAAAEGPYHSYTCNNQRAVDVFVRYTYTNCWSLMVWCGPLVHLVTLSAAAAGVLLGSRSYKEAPTRTGARQDMLCMPNEDVPCPRGWDGGERRGGRHEEHWGKRGGGGGRGE
jgi:hypothetical protein